MGELPDITPKEPSLAVDELSRVSIDFLSQMTTLWLTSSRASIRALNQGRTIRLASSSVVLLGTCPRSEARLESVMSW